MIEILSIVDETVKKEKMQNVSIIKVSIGKEILVMQDALQFAFDHLKKGSVTNGARLIQEEVEGRDLRIDYIEGE